MNYAQLLKDPRWKAKRREILDRDDDTCQECSRKPKLLHVHHLKYEGRPWEIPNEWLITLCKVCHAKKHRISKKLKTTLKSPKKKNLSELQDEKASSKQRRLHSGLLWDYFLPAKVFKFFLCGGST